MPLWWRKRQAKITAFGDPASGSYAHAFGSLFTQHPYPTYAQSTWDGVQSWTQYDVTTTVMAVDGQAPAAADDPDQDICRVALLNPFQFNQSKLWRAFRA